MTKLSECGYEMTHDFKPGDVVRFKSKGNLMTIEKVDSVGCCVVHCGDRISVAWVLAITLEYPDLGPE
jgi:uncharacterized protein YodC (DUF2158 family)